MNCQFFVAQETNNSIGYLGFVLYLYGGVPGCETHQVRGSFDACAVRSLSEREYKHRLLHIISLSKRSLYFRPPQSGSNILLFFFSPLPAEPLLSASHRVLFSSSPVMNLARRARCRTRGMHCCSAVGVHLHFFREISEAPHL